MNKWIVILSVMVVGTWAYATTQENECYTKYVTINGNKRIDKVHYVHADSTIDIQYYYNKTGSWITILTVTAPGARVEDIYRESGTTLKTLSVVGHRLVSCEIGVYGVLDIGTEKSFLSYETAKCLKDFLKDE